MQEVLISYFVTAGRKFPIEKILSFLLQTNQFHSDLIRNRTKTSCLIKSDLRKLNKDSNPIESVLIRAKFIICHHS